MINARYFRIVSVVLASTMMFQASAAALTSIGTSLHLALQGDPPEYEGTPGPIYYGPNPARDAVYQNGAWNDGGKEALHYLEEDAIAQRAMPLTTAPQTAPENPVPTNPNPEQTKRESKGTEFPGEPTPRPDHSLAEGSEGRPYVDPGIVGGGHPLPWEAAFPGGGSNSTGAILNSNTGNRLTTVPIVSVPVRGGMALSLNLYHNSVTRYDGRFGNKWSSDLDANLKQYNYVNGATNAWYIVIRWGDGSVIQYDRDAVDIWKFNAPAGLYHSVRQTGWSGNWEVTMKDGTKYVFETPTPGAGGTQLTGLLKSIKDRDLNTITIEREYGSGRPTIVKEPTLRQFSFGYYPSGLVKEFKDCGQLTAPIGNGNRKWTFGYTNNNLTSITYPPVVIGATAVSRTFTYDTLGNSNITVEGDLRGKLWNCTYNAQNQLTGFKQPGVATSATFTYNASNTVYTNTRTAVGQQVHNYTSGKIASIRDEQLFSVSGTFDALRRQGTFTNELGRTWIYDYDANGNVLTTTHPTSGGQTKVDTATYNSDNTLQASWNNAMGSNKVSYTYYNNRPTSAKRDFPLNLPDLQLFQASYDGNGLLLSKTLYGPGGNSVTSFGYTQYGTPKTVTDPNNKVSTVNTSILGWVESTVNTLNKVTTIHTDAWGRPTEIVKPGGTVSVKVEYDNEGNVTKLTDERSKVHTWTYYDRGPVFEYTNAKGEKETYTYDNENFRLTVVNGRGYTRTYTPAIRGEVRKLVLPGGATEFWTYDGNGNVVNYRTAMGHNIGYEYDELDRPKATNYGDASTPDVDFAYSNYGLNSTMTDGTGVTTWTSNSWGDLTNFSTPQGTVSYDYGSNGLGLKVSTTETQTGSTARTTSFEYDNFQRLKKLTNQENQITLWHYDDGGRMDKRTLGNGTWEDVTYDDWNRPLSITLKKPTNQTIRAQSYTYDDASNVVTHTLAGVVTNYEYDNINQLTREYRGTSGSPTWNQAYTYDANGNRASKTLNGVTEIYNNDLGDRLTSIKDATNTVTIKSFGYDSAGRRTSMFEPGIGTTIYTWDRESRLTAVNRTGSYPITVANGYNGLDARTVKIDSSGTNEYFRNGAGVTSPVVSDSNANYTPGISEKRGSATRYLHSGLKNADSRTIADKTIEATREYDAFGNVIGSTGTWNGPFGNAGGFGYQEDPDHGLKLLGHRYYDSSTGRFLSRDPAEDGRNWYTYCENNPLNGVDPTGSVKVCLIWRPVVTVPVPTGFDDLGGVSTTPVTAYHVAIVVIDNQNGNTEPSWTFGGGRTKDGKCYSIGGPWATGTIDHDAARKSYGRYSNGNVPAVTLVDDDSPMLKTLIDLAYWDNQLHDLNFPYFPVPYSDDNANSGSWGHELIIRMGWEDQYQRAMRKRRKAGHSDPISPGFGHRPPTFRGMNGLVL
ncbi:MAG: RHS repeat-associated core domain-containing protein [Fimbriimonadaceae bacterium]